MPQPRTRGRADQRSASPIGRYHGVFFGCVADAVEYCQRLVPHVVPRLRDAAGESAPVVWFHVPPSDGTARGCWLYLSDGAVQVARSAGLSCEVLHACDRTQLPRAAVLIFGEDRLDPPAPDVDVRRTRGSRITSLAADLPEADVILR